MNILANVHLYVPNHNAGAELMLHQLLKDLKAKGHTCHVITGNPASSEHEGIQLYAPCTKNLTEQFRWASVVITHLDRTQESIRYAKWANKPLVHLIHNDRQVDVNALNRKKAALVVANSEWIFKSITRDLDKIVCIPPLKVSDYHTPRVGHDITLINLSKAKGAPTFYALAERMPERSFCGVVGGYAPQLITKLPNVRIQEHTPDIKSVYAKTRILLVPSAYESWGRVAMEACCSGIPVIACPTPGLLESLGDAGLFASTVEEFEAHINALDDEATYAKQCAIMEARAKVIESLYQTQFEAFHQRLLKLGR